MQIKIKIKSVESMDKWRARMNVFLKMKLKSFAAEARIIRAQELKTRGTRHNATREALHLHRVRDVRRAARETHLAYAYLRGRAYSAVEHRAYSAPDWAAVEKMIKKYGSDKLEGLKLWHADKLPLARHSASG